MGQETGRRLIGAIQKQTEKVTYFCTSENVSPHLAVHEMRKCFKRIRALLRFYMESPEDFTTNYLNQFQSIGSLLSPVRESYVNIQIFDRITAGNILVQERKIKQARELFLEKNRLQTENLMDKDKELKNILKSVREFKNHLTGSVSTQPSVKQIFAEICNSYLTGYNLYVQTALVADGNELHELRKKLKRLWYQLDFVKYLHPRYFRLKSDQLNKITEYLGDEHDMYVFLSELRTGDFDFKSEEKIILENLVEHQRELNLLKLSPRLKQLFNESPEMFNQKMEKIFKVY